MPENTLRVFSSPTSSVSCNSLSDPSTAVQSTIFAIRRSIFAKSSMEIVPSACGAFSFAAFFEAEFDPATGAATAAAAACPGAIDSRFAAINASICFGSTRVIKCLYALIGCDELSGDETSVQTSGAIPRNASTDSASNGNTGFNASDNNLNASTLTLQVSCSAAAFAGSFARSQGLDVST